MIVLFRVIVVYVTKQADVTQVWGCWSNIIAAGKGAPGTVRWTLDSGWWIGSWVLMVCVFTRAVCVWEDKGVWWMIAARHLWWLPRLLRPRHKHMNTLTSRLCRWPKVLCWYRWLGCLWFLWEVFVLVAASCVCVCACVRRVAHSDELAHS